MAPAQEGMVLQALHAFQNEVHCQQGLPECETGPGGDGTNRGPAGSDVSNARLGAYQGTAVCSDGVTVNLPRPALELAAGAARGSASCGVGLRAWVGVGVGHMGQDSCGTGGVV